MLKVSKPGFYASVQDLGRPGYRHFGVPLSGAADRLAARRVNALLENDPGDAVLEMAMQGPELVFDSPTYIALSGAGMDVRLNGQELHPDQVYPVPAGSVLECGRITKGFRAYLGIRGGLRIPKILGSRSMFYPVTEGRQIRAGQELPYEPCAGFEAKILKLSPMDLYLEEALVASPGPEFELLEPAARERLFGDSFTLAKEYDRMACQLQETLPAHTLQMITSATLPGTVQLTPAGRLIILMPDGQTTGGYPRVLQLDNRSVSVLSQKKFSDRVRFVENPS
ncbi:5-oxoprolinase subunit C family protein [Robiginitalea sediminis]|uniref:5-oxoprolinase subunit C family protein n=1 Tax=Robiginitalea sediminis TaxID=1982593 RepID=UPI000B4BB926|nr:biotin-dependent carboxyltransferase family protein [Robiginitalea sediminis]